MLLVGEHNGPIDVIDTRPASPISVKQKGADDEELWLPTYITIRRHFTATYEWIGRFITQLSPDN
jgi:hypothetical protein